MRLRTFTFRLNSEERRVLDTLAQTLQRTQSDAVRWLIRNAAREVGAAQPANAPGDKGGSHDASASD